MGFAERLKRACSRAGNAVVAGIDPRPESLPSGFLEGFARDRSGVADAFEAFATGVIEVLSPLVPAVKFQAAFYEAYGPEGMRALQRSVAQARRNGLIVLIDGKRNDIGSTAEAYAQAYLGDAGRVEPPWDADALTINAYLGRDGVEPFLKAASHRDRGVFALVKTSNSSSGDVQDLISGGRPIYRHMAELVNDWAGPHRDVTGYSLLGAVVGATYPEQLAELREAMPGVIFLVPGYGVQGGTASDVASAFDAEGFGAIINNSRGLTFAYQRRDLAGKFGKDWQRSIEFAAKEMIDDLAANTPAGRLAERFSTGSNRIPRVETT